MVPPERNLFHSQAMFFCTSCALAVIHMYTLADFPVSCTFRIETRIHIVSWHISVTFIPNQLYWMSSCLLKNLYLLVNHPKKCYITVIKTSDKDAIIVYVNLVSLIVKTVQIQIWSIMVSMPKTFRVLRPFWNGTICLCLFLCSWLYRLYVFIKVDSFLFE